MSRLFLLLTLSGCTWISAEGYLERADQDADGVEGTLDCDDADAQLQAPVRYYEDRDGDGAGDPSAPVDACATEAPPGTAVVAGDCDDDAADVHPSASEACNGVDDDCDGKIDDEDDDLDGATASVWFPDADGDGFPTSASLEAAERACVAPAGFSAAQEQLDCNDDQAAVNPGRVEICDDGLDNDCDGATDDRGQGATTFYRDADADGWPDSWIPDERCDSSGEGWVPATEAPPGTDVVDCDPEDPLVFPGALDAWYDGIDSNCDLADDFDQDADGFRATSGGGLDCDDTNAAIAPGLPDPFYDGTDSNCDLADDFDQDGDGFVALAYGGADCDDTQASVRPGAPDPWYDGIDSDCDGADDFDQDGDGERAPSGGGADCDDLDALRYPEAEETWYDGIDTNCDGANDFDQDGDGVAALQVGGADCDDLEALTFPGATETWYDGIDSNCDGADDFDQDGDGEATAEGGGADCDDTDPRAFTGGTDVWYDGIDGDCDGADDFDQDADGHPTPAGGGADCDDLDPNVFPGGAEAPYDDVDGNCDGADDFDFDGDGFRDPRGGGSDCDDGDPLIYPGAADDWYDGIDSNCAGDSDYDQDGDGRTPPTAPLGSGDDCDDLDPATYAGAPEQPDDGVDQDCNGVDATRCYSDSDLDGYGGPEIIAVGGVCEAPLVATGGDCDDLDPESWPGAPELCDLVDQDCNGIAEDGVATLTDREGVRSPLLTNTFDSATTERLDLCGGTWDVAGTWDPDDGSVWIVGHPSFDTPVIEGTQPLLQGAGPGRSRATLRRLALRHESPTTTGVIVTGERFERPEVVLEEIDVDGASMRALLETVDANVVINQLEATSSAFELAALSIDRGALTLTDSAFTDLSRGLQDVDAGLVWGRNLYAEVRSTQFLGNEGRAAAFHDSTLLLTQTTWQDNHYDSSLIDGTGANSYGGALLLNDSNLDEVGSVFSGNSAQAAGGAVAVRGGSQASFSGTEFSDNGVAPDGSVVERGGALFAEGDLALEDVLFTDSEARLSGASFQHQGGELDIDDSSLLLSTLLTGNEGVAFSSDASDAFVSGLTVNGLVGEEGGSCLRIKGAGILSLSRLVLDGCNALCLDLESSSSSSLNSTDLSGCVGNSSGHGGAVRWLGEPFRLRTSNNVFDGNESDGDGGAIHTDARNYEGSGNTFRNNIASRDGGALSLLGSTGEICGSLFEDNLAGNDGGAIASDSSVEFGIGLFNCSSEATVRRNEALGVGGGVRMRGNRRLRLQRVTLEDNYAVAGGGAYVEGYVSSGFNGFVLDNEAATTGGGLHIQSITFGTATTLSRLRFEGNVAVTGGGMYLEGGGFSQNSPPTMFNLTEFVGNEAGTGAAFYVEEMSSEFTFPGFPVFLLSDSFAGNLVLDSNLGPTAVTREAVSGNWALDIDVVSPQVVDGAGSVCSLSPGPVTLDCPQGAPCVCP